MTVGTVYPAEWRTYHDPQTGRAVTQLTNSPAEDYHLYFYNPTVTPNGRYLIFYSERTGLSNMFRLNLGSGEIVQLTDASPTRAEYWPFTEPVKGVGACLSALGSGGREVFYFEGNDLYGVGIESLQSRRLLTVPPDRRPSMLNANATGDTLVFATWDEALFADWSKRAYAGEQFPDNAFYQQTASTLMRVDVASGKTEEVLRLENFWINHVLIHPHNHNLLEFCHEYTNLPDRMWLLNTATGEYGAIPGQAATDWYEHEFWSADGLRIYFHAGHNADDTNGFCGWCSPVGSEHHEFHHQTAGRTYGHYNLHPDGDMITDGEARPGCISRVRLVDGQQDYEVLCRHDSYRFGDDQRCHPHPSFTPDGRQVVFTSNQTGTSNVYLTNWN
jgi:oligogalacturonide lyase